MKPGDMVTTIEGATLLSESLEKITSINKVHYGLKREVLHFRNKDLAIVIACHPNDHDRVKLFYQGDFWWANVKDLKIVSS